MAYYIPTVGKVGGTHPPCPPPNCTHGHKVLHHKGRWQEKDTGLQSS